MIGYHFTTAETYRQIRHAGLQLAPLLPKPGLDDIAPYLGDGGIWLYRRYLTGRKLLGMLLYVAINHHSDRIVRARVEYDVWQAVTFQAERDLGSKHSPVHHLTGVGQYDHLAEPFEVLTTPVEPNRIRLLNYWNLMDIITGASKCRTSTT